MTFYHQILKHACNQTGQIKQMLKCEGNRNYDPKIVDAKHLYGQVWVGKYLVLRNFNIEI